MKNTFIWISYDLGVTGDYEGLYAWLDNLGAKECGSGMAFVKNFEFEGDLIGTLKSEIKDHVSLTKRTRIYILHDTNGPPTGQFIFGRRKSSAWAGYGDDPEQELDGI